MKLNIDDVATLWAVAYIAILLHQFSLIGSALEIGGIISIFVLLLRFVKRKIQKK